MTKNCIIILWPKGMNNEYSGSFGRFIFFFVASLLSFSSSCPRSLVTRTNEAMSQSCHTQDRVLHVSASAACRGLQGFCRHICSWSASSHPGPAEQERGLKTLGGTKFASKLNWKTNTPESCSFWVTDTGNISFSTQIHCFHQVLYLGHL